MTDLTFEEVNKRIRYEAETGKLFWLPRSASMFSGGRPGGAETAAKIWNARFADKEAFSLKGDGYIQIGIWGRHYLAHRLAWLLHTGAWPAAHLDHINGIRTDNRIANLRDVSHAENNRNRRLSANNTSGVIGVSWDKRDKKWKAQIRVDGRMKHIGLFDDFDLAAAARAEANVKFAFHPNHGRST